MSLEQKSRRFEAGMLPKENRSRVQFEIFDILGRLGEVLVDEEQQARYHEVRWDARVPSGTYPLRITAVALDGVKEDFLQIKKMVLIR